MYMQAWGMSPTFNNVVGNKATFGEPWSSLAAETALKCKHVHPISLLISHSLWFSTASRMDSNSLAGHTGAFRGLTFAYFLHCCLRPCSPCLLPCRYTKLIVGP